MRLGWNRAGDRDRSSVADRFLMTDRLVLRPARVDDLDALLATIDGEVIRWQGYPSEPVQLRKYFDNWLRREKKIRSYEHWLICDSATNDVIGSRSLWPSKGNRGTCETGSWLGPGWRGRGLGVEELMAVLQLVEGHRSYTTVVAGTEDSNRAARRQYEHCGFVVFSRPDKVLHQLPDGRTVPVTWLCRTAPANRASRRQL